MRKHEYTVRIEVSQPAEGTLVTPSEAFCTARELIYFNPLALEVYITPLRLEGERTLYSVPKMALATHTIAFYSRSSPFLAEQNYWLVQAQGNLSSLRKLRTKPNDYSFYIWCDKETEDWCALVSITDGSLSKWEKMVAPFKGTVLWQAIAVRIDRADQCPFKLNLIEAHNDTKRTD